MAGLGAGTQFKMGDGESSEVFTKVTGVKTIGSVGTEKPLVDVTAMDDLGKKYISGIAEGQEMEIIGNFETSDADQKTFRDAAIAGTVHNFQVVYPNGVTGDINLTLLGFMMNEPEGESALTFTVKAKQNGVTVWSGES